MKIGTACDVCKPSCKCKLIGTDLNNLALFKKIKFKKEETSVGQKFERLKTIVGAVIVQALKALEEEQDSSA